MVPQQDTIREFRLAKELTQFRFLKDATAYPLFLKNFRTSFENAYEKLVLTRIPAGQLNPPSVLADTSWIKPGKAAWDWWSGSSGSGSSVKGGMNTETMKYFAAQSGFEYLLIDAGWSAHGDVTKMNPDVDVPGIVQYAGAKGVKVWLWMHWTQADRQMDEAFPIYEKWGVAGVEIDFMDSNDQRIVRFYHRAAKTAAAHHLMVDFHGAYPPTGMQRNYPNVLTHEGVLGLEYNKWSAVPDPDHNTMLPFTRMLAGPMDYTPGGFDNRTKADFEARDHDPMVMGTRAHQLAVIARRQGDAWYLGAITNWSARELRIPLTFLGDGEYAADIFADAADSDQYPKNVSIERRRVDRSGALVLRLASGGGCAVRLMRAAR